MFNATHESAELFLSAKKNLQVDLPQEHHRNVKYKVALTFLRNLNYTLVEKISGLSFAALFQTRAADSNWQRFRETNITVPNVRRKID